MFQRCHEQNMEAAMNNLLFHQPRWDFRQRRGTELNLC